MFILDKNKFGDFDLENVGEFIEFWSYYYKDTTKDETGKIISYIEELNLNNDLTRQNVIRLLRWKDPLRLTEKIGEEKKDNRKVLRVLENLNNLNDFRDKKTSENGFEKVVTDIFPNGTVWPVFLFHIARPYEYPIADKNVCCAFSILSPQNPEEKISEYDWESYWKNYRKYKDFFFSIAKSAGIIIHEPKGDENNIFEIVTGLKKVDDALFAFGKFLYEYDK